MKTRGRTVCRRSVHSNNKQRKNRSEFCFMQRQKRRDVFLLILKRVSRLWKLRHGWAPGYESAVQVCETNMWLHVEVDRCFPPLQALTRWRLLSNCCVALCCSVEFMKTSPRPWTWRHHWTTQHNRPLFVSEGQGRGYKASWAIITNYDAVVV